MPELPEVEITRRQLVPALIERRIRALRTTGPSYFFLTPPAELTARLVGRRVCALDRLGKYLVAGLDDGGRLLLHLGMTGQLFSEGAASVALLSSTGAGTLSPRDQRGFRVDQHTHLVFELDGRGGDVFFRDPRKFGKVQWLAPGVACERIDKLGPDALSASGAQLFSAARGRRAAIKGLLLDQTVLAGVGNIYADEALHFAGVRPGRAAGRVTRAEADRIAEGIVRVMQRSIETGGSSISDYIHPDGERGRYQDERMVYAREGQPCKRCGAPIARRTIAQRSSHYCPKCQK